MIDQNRKAFRDEDYNDDPNYNPTSDKIGYDVGQKFDDAGLPNPYIEDHDQVMIVMVAVCRPTLL